MAKRKPEDMTPEELERALNPRQKRFVLEYLRNGGNGQEAAVKAGYSPKAAAAQASRMLNDAKVAAYMRAQARVLYDSIGLTPEKIGLELWGIFRRCMAAEPHLSWDTAAHDYVPDGTWTFDAKGATRCLELLGKMEGVFREKVEVTGGVEDYLRRLAERGETQRL